MSFSFDCNCKVWPIATWVWGVNFAKAFMDIVKSRKTILSRGSEELTCLTPDPPALSQFWFPEMLVEVVYFDYAESECKFLKRCCALILDLLSLRFIITDQRLVRRINWRIKEAFSDASGLKVLREGLLIPHLLVIIVYFSIVFWEKCNLGPEARSNENCTTNMGELWFSSWM